MARAEQREILVLAAEDSPDDYLLMEQAFGKVERIRLVGRAADGGEAIAYLKGEGQYADRKKFPFPDLLLLDLKMPGVDGFDVLRWLQTQSFPDLFVIVLSGSERREDMAQALQLGAHYYQTKQIDLAHQTSMIKLLEQYMVRQRREPPR
jgi:CheY-like chemotaxis protein